MQASRIQKPSINSTTPSGARRLNVAQPTQPGVPRYPPTAIPTVRKNRAGMATQQLKASSHAKRQVDAPIINRSTR